MSGEAVFGYLVLGFLVLLAVWGFTGQGIRYHRRLKLERKVAGRWGNLTRRRILGFIGVVVTVVFFILGLGLAGYATIIALIFLLVFSLGSDVDKRRRAGAARAQWVDEQRNRDDSHT